jgi:hypothetical protein
MHIAHIIVESCRISTALQPISYAHGMQHQRTGNTIVCSAIIVTLLPLREHLSKSNRLTRASFGDKYKSGLLTAALSSCTGAKKVAARCGIIAAPAVISLRLRRSAIETRAPSEEATSPKISNSTAVAALAAGEGL